MPEFTLPYCVINASDPLCTTNASTTPVSVLLSLSTSMKYFAALNDAWANVSMLSVAESTSAFVVVTVTPDVASDVFAVDNGIL